MNNDGWGFLGAGTSDNRIAGEDLQHNRQTRTADELHGPVRMVTQSYASGGPMKQFLDEELHRHRDAHDMRLADLKNHYER
jgi:hypothetical protein